MKKYFLLLLFPLLFSCCSEEEKGNEELVGSCWYLEDSSFDNERVCFGAGRASYSYVVSGNYRSYELDYTYKKPNIKIIHNDGSLFGEGYIEGDKMYLKGTHHDVYIKTNN